MKTSFRVQSVLSFHHGYHGGNYVNKTTHTCITEMGVIEKNRNNRKVSEYHTMHIGSPSPHGASAHDRSRTCPAHWEDYTSCSLIWRRSLFKYHQFARTQEEGL
uniref:Uncharacterized protein n=1 Tax=Zea mays TaxID=4577 RepID=C0PA74_MAIZE|nr:unknown [Zea mays]